MSLRTNGSSGTKVPSDLTSIEAQSKAAIDQFKRSGEFDRIRKDTLRQWESSEEGTAFRQKLQAIVTKEVERDQGLLARDRGKAATLIGGAVERTQLYPEARLAAARHIFQSQEFKTRIYESLKKYMTPPDQAQAKESASDVTDKNNMSARDAAQAFIEREQEGT